MKEIKLTQGKVALVDDEDFLFLNRWKWDCDSINKTNYAKMNFLDSNTGKNIKIYMHRLIMGCPGSMFIDHIDHNGLNNQKSNLRICTRSENLRNNIRNNKKHSSKYRGVHVRQDGIIVAYYDYNRKRYHVGCFKTEEDAARARDEAIARIDKKFYVFNF